MILEIDIHRNDVTTPQFSFILQEMTKNVTFTFRVIETSWMVYN